MIILGGVLISLVGFFSLFMSVGAVGLETFAVLTVFNAVCMMLGGLLIALGYAKILKFQEELNRIKSKN